MQDMQNMEDMFFASLHDSGTLALSKEEMLLPYSV